MSRRSVRTRNASKPAGMAAAAAVLALIFSTPTLADKKNVPFQASFAGLAWFDSPTSAVFQGIGQASHLGRSTNSGYLAPLIPILTSECEAGWGIPHINEETLTAANGDQLVLIMMDLACPIAPNVFRGTGSWFVSHGTGRFSDATGSGIASGGGDFNLGTFEFTLTGSIAY